jgi:signal transduction histidine kinase
MSRSNIAALLLTVFIHASLWAQDTTLQRLMKTKDDTVKVKQLTRHAMKVAESDIPKSMAMMREIVHLCEKIGYTKGSGQAWLDIGALSFQSGDGKTAIDNFKKAIPYFEKINRKDKVAACYLNMGAASGMTGDVQGKINAIMAAIRLLEGTSETSLLTHAFNAMGILFYNLDNFEKARTYFEKALRIAKEGKDTAERVQASFGISDCLAASKRFGEALKYAQDALVLATASGDKYLLFLANTGLASLYNKWGKGEPAVKFSTRALGYATALNEMPRVVTAYIDMADGYALLGAYAKQIAYLNKALHIAKQNGIVIQLDDIYKSLAEGHEKTGNTSLALASMKQYIIYKDSADNVKDNRVVAEMETKYQAAQKEKSLADRQLQLTQKDLQLQKSRQYIAYSVAATVVAILLTGLLYMNYAYKKKAHARKLKELQQENELQVLQGILEGEEKERSRIAKDLHDGVAGMLAAVKMHFTSVSLQHGAVREAEGYVNGMRLLDEASTEVRKTSHNLMPEILLQRGLEEALRRYCTNVSNSNLLFIQYDSWGDIRRFKGSFELSVYRIVQELINNILRHSRATKVMVQLSQQESLLSITIEDNGIGIQPEKGSADGTGLYNLRDRVKAMKGSLQIESGPGSGVSAYLEFDTAGLERKPAAGAAAKAEAVA